MGFEAPDWDFVQKEYWDAELDGEWDQSKVAKKLVLGIDREGIWVLRGRAGGFRWKHREGTSTRQSTVQDDGMGPLAAESLKNKLDVINAGKQQFEKDRAAKHVVRPAMGVTDMLKLLQDHGNQLGGASSERSTEGLGLLAGSREQGSRADDADEAECEDARGPGASSLASIFGSTSSASSATKGPSAGGSSTKPAGPTRSQDAGAKNQAPAGGRKTKSDSANASVPALERKHADAVFDGRVRRIRESLTFSADSLDVEIRSVCFNEDLQTGGDKAKKAALTELFRQKSRKLSKIEGDATMAVSRVKNSANGDALQDIEHRLLALLATTKQISSFHQMVTLERGWGVGGTQEHRPSGLL